MQTETTTNGIKTVRCEPRLGEELFTQKKLHFVMAEALNI